MRNITLSVLLGLSLTACVTGYSDVPSDEAYATVVFEKAYEKNTTVGNLMQGYVIYEDGDCNKPRNAASFTSLQGETKERRVSAMTPLVFIAAINEQSGNLYSDGLAETCAFKAEFQPVSGKKYRISHSGLGSDCKLEVTDYETGNAVQSLMIEGAFTSNSSSPKKNVLGYPCE